MSFIRQTIHKLLRSTGGLGTADYVRYLLQKGLFAPHNRKVSEKYPSFAFPPEPLLYEIGGQLDFERYRTSGLIASEFLVEHFRTIDPVAPKAVLDWGCGVSCVCRHMPDLLPAGTRVIGCDINGPMIEWGKAYIDGIEYLHSGLMPPLPIEDGVIRWIYALSVFTHLSMAAFDAWLKEMGRVLSSGGVFLFTTNSPSTGVDLLDEEAEEIQRVGFLVRGNISEGRKMYLAYHHPPALRLRIEELGGWDIVCFTASGMPFTNQDVWILKKL